MQEESLNSESSSVQTHLTIMQGVIRRMGYNSNACKVWCLTLVSVVILITTRENESAYILMAVVPVMVLFLLNTYYHSKELGFRRSYDDFVGKVHRGEIELSDLYLAKTLGTGRQNFLSSIRSFSIWPFYATLCLVIVLAWIIIF